LRNLLNLLRFSPCSLQVLLASGNHIRNQTLISRLIFTDQNY